jgi:hypothetical protein
VEFSCLIRSRRQQFNREWSSERYAHFLKLIENRCGEPPPFRHSETPCFLPKELVDRMARYGGRLYQRLFASQTRTRIHYSFRLTLASTKILNPNWSKFRAFRHSMPTSRFSPNAIAKPSTSIRIWRASQEILTAIRMTP